MNERPKVDLVALKAKVLENALEIPNTVNQENYLQSCINHGGDIAAVALEVRDSLRIVKRKYVYECPCGKIKDGHRFYIDPKRLTVENQF